ncbi:VanZ family protein [Lapidilactobacillus wuchangensis]|uniref:VanZ family protein n=1 Tax=Lapidilactobacillus wuchangensis TaxID=2486001 RepID=UPI001CDB5190|nr:VanZ family protein [Lapidilactobacillus wuchangensis]
MPTRREKVFLILAVVMMLILFISSAMTYQQQTIVPELKHFDWPWWHRILDQMKFTYAGKTISVAAQGYAGMTEFLLRKLAHFGSYFLLAGFGYLGLLSVIPVWGFRLPLTWLAATGYAALDEFHQLLTSGRSPMIQDVMLDSCGALAGLLLALLIAYLHQRQQVKRFGAISQFSMLRPIGR